MDEPLARRLLRAARLTRPGGLAEATSVIQRALQDLPGVPSGQTPAWLPKLDALRRKGPAAAEPDRSGGRFLAGSFACAAGTRPYRLYVPSRPAARPALLVMLHGCTQTPEDFAAGTRMNVLAEGAGALVLYPAQTARANAQRCWNWFNPADQQAGQGEPAIIAGMTRQVMAEYGVNPAQVFAAGLSAGGAHAAILGAAYPDLFRKIGVHSGLACGAASDGMSALSAMKQGRAGHGRIAVPAIVFHGDRDTTVNMRNADELAAQTARSGAGQTEQGQVPGGLAYTKAVYRHADGRVALEQWTVHGASHAWSGGSATGSYTEPHGPDASREMLRFFLETSR